MAALRDWCHRASGFTDGNVRHTGIKLLAQGHIASVWYNPNGTSGSPKLKLTSITARLHM